MPETATAQATQLIPCDLSGYEVWRNHLEQLPLRAIAAFIVRHNQRHGPLRRLKQLRIEAFASGVDTSVKCHERPISQTIANGTSTLDNGFRIPDDAALAADDDLKNLLDLKLGNPNELGEPIPWNDPRLGPLWPGGPPEWYIEAENECRELEERLRNTPDIKALPNDPLLGPHRAEWLKLDELYNEGKLNEYRGEYVIWGDGKVFAHGRHLLNIRLQAEELAGSKGINPNQLIDYFVPGE
jgi:hypothetical protein